MEKLIELHNVILLPFAVKITAFICKFAHVGIKLWRTILVVNNTWNKLQDVNDNYDGICSSHQLLIYGTINWLPNLLVIGLLIECLTGLLRTTNIVAQSWKVDHKRVVAILLYNYVCAVMTKFGCWWLINCSGIWLKTLD